MSKKENPRKTRSYYKFSKQYPSRLGKLYAIGESRKVRKKERVRKIFLAVFLCCLFIPVYVAGMFCHNLLTRPLPDETQGNAETVITADNIGTVRAIYIENSLLGETDELKEALGKAESNGFNAVMLDFKTRDGYLAYSSSASAQPGTGSNNLINDTVIDIIKDSGMYIIGRIFCFEDGVAPQRLNAFVYEDEALTGIWLDAPAVNGGKPWLNPASASSSAYLCSVIAEVSLMGADCIYLDSVQFPPSRTGSGQFFTQDDSSLVRNSVLMDFIEKAVKAAGFRPVFLGMPLECAAGGDAEKWGGTLFDTAASICSPFIAKPDGGDYADFVKAKTSELNTAAQNNFSTIKVIPTVQNQPDDGEFFKKMASESEFSYIILP